MSEFADKLAALTAAEAAKSAHDPDKMGEMIERLATALGFTIALASKGHGPTIDNMIAGAEAHAYAEAVEKSPFAAFMGNLPFSHRLWDRRKTMAMKNKFIEDAALVIDGRVAALEAELSRDLARGVGASSLASDRAAIGEAKHLARMIRSLKIGTYRDPYKAAYDHWNHGRAADNANRD